MRTSENEEVDYDECIAYLSKGQQQSIGIDVSNLKIPMICVDIDNPEVGEVIIDALSKSEPDENALKVLGSPFAVKTPTKGHIHLYYKAQKGIVDKGETFRKLLPTRLGFKAEFIYGNVTVAGLNRHPFYVPTLNQISELPKSLYPYNFPKTDTVFSLFNESTDEKGKKFFKRLTSGERNNKLFDFHRVYDFGIDHLTLSNKLCCDPPLPHDEISKGINKSITEYFKKKRSKASEAYFNAFELTIKPIKSSKKNLAPEFIDETDERMQRALERKTTADTIEFVGFTEKHLDFKFPDNEWMG